MNAIRFLTEEHNKVKEKLRDISDDSHRDETKRKKFAEVCEVLLRHETMEHEVWYPHFANQLRKEVRHLISEEKSAEKAIKKFENIKTQEAWEEQFNKFKNDIEHHATEEEQELFPEVQKLLDESTLEKIGIEMFHFKKDNPV